MRVLITGANRGIGAGLRSAFKARGDEVIATSRDVPEEPGWTGLDLRDPASIAALSQGLGGGLGLLVANAGVYLDKGEPLDTGYPSEMWAETFAVNVTGVFLTIQALLPSIRAAMGKIAIISSQMASDTHAPGGAYIYRSSKAAALNLGRNLAADLKSDGIAVGIYHPGWVRTDMGGSGADIVVEEAVAGLVARFDELNIGSTGCFRTWDGHDHPY